MMIDLLVVCGGYRYSFYFMRKNCEIPTGHVFGNFESESTVVEERRML
jgi:hypothetical protein